MMAFAKMPVEAFTDHRLTLKQIRVLGAILSFSSKDGSSCHPKRQAIAERCGMNPDEVSRTTTQLVALGWLKKEGSGGFSQPSSYVVTVPELAGEPCTIHTALPCTNQTGLRENNPVRIEQETLYESDSSTLYESDRGKEETIDQTNTRPEPTCEKIVERRKGKQPMTIDRFLAVCKETGEMPIPEDDPVFGHAELTKVPRDFLRLCWLEFREINRQSGKRYKDWRAAFRNCVRAEWYRLWYTDAEGNVSLTSKGNAAMLRHGRQA